MISSDESTKPREWSSRPNTFRWAITRRRGNEAGHWQEADYRAVIGPQPGRFAVPDTKVKRP